MDLHLFGCPNLYWKADPDPDLGAWEKNYNLPVYKKSFAHSVVGMYFMLRYIFVI
jgi:hypothetical protein